jgi:hypothetical protein
MPDGRFSNLYTVRIVNKTTRPMAVALRLESPPGELRVMGGDIVVPPAQLAENAVLVELDRAVMRSGSTPLLVGVYSQGRKLQTVKTAFIGPRDDTR